MIVALFEPEIPSNTGNIARLCAATRSELHLIEPLGFRLDDRQLKRAGMDYWRRVRWRRWPHWKAFIEQEGKGRRLWFIESTGDRLYTEADYGSEDILVFGRETAGLPAALLRQHPDRVLRIPLFHPEARSLNLSNCAALVLFEALRQLNFPGAI